MNYPRGVLSGQYNASRCGTERAAQRPQRRRRSGQCGPCGRKTDESRRHRQSRTDYSLDLVANRRSTPSWRCGSEVEVESTRGWPIVHQRALTSCKQRDAQKDDAHSVHSPGGEVWKRSSFAVSGSEHCLRRLGVSAHGSARTGQRQLHLQARSFANRSHSPWSRWTRARFTAQN